MKDTNWNLRMMIKTSGFTQKDVADELGIDFSTLSVWLRTKHHNAQIKDALESLKRKENDEMRATKKDSNLKERVLVNLKELQALCGCGRCCAEEIAEKAEASVRIGRRHLFNVNKIQAYLDSIAQ